MTDLITAEEAEKLLDECDGDDCLTCEYARTVIALHAQLADAQAAQAMVVERCADKAHECWADGVPPPEYEEYILALAPIDGLALVQELRDRAEKAEAELQHEKALCAGAEANLKEVMATAARISAANAVLEAKVAGLGAAFRVNMLRYGPPGTSHEEIDAAIDAAIATQEAGT